jgi:hypothetical protein
MKSIAAILLLAVSVALSGCGSNSTVNGNINGSWNATLDSSGNEMFGFITVLTVNGGGALGTSNILISVNNTPCVFPVTTESGSFTISGNFNGQVSGAFHYVVTSTGATVNTLTLDGTVSGGQISGTWTVTGASGGCSGNGTFTMIPMPGG